MKLLYSVRPKLKVALTMLTLIVAMLCGVLLERSFFNQVNQCSSSIYNDRLVPSTAVYHLSDHITQRRLLAENYVQNFPQSAKNTPTQLAAHEKEMDSIVAAFEETYLVKKESKSLESLKKHLDHYNRVEQELLATAKPEQLAATVRIYNNIRGELMELSQIQTNVGQDLLNESRSITSNAGVISHFQVVLLIVACLVVQALILASKSINSPFRQRHNLN